MYFVLFCSITVQFADRKFLIPSEWSLKNDDRSWSDLRLGSFRPSGPCYAL